MTHMERVEIIARGDVQRVGFRDIVQKIARDLGISGSVENQEPYDVKIVAEGQREVLNEFVQALRIQRGAVQVRELEISWTTPTDEFPYFKILRGEWQEELGERFDVASGMLNRNMELSEQILMVSRESLSIGKSMLDRQDKMLDRQEKTIEEIRGVRSDLQEYMNKRFVRIEGEIGKIKKAIEEMGGSCI